MNDLNCFKLVKELGGEHVEYDSTNLLSKIDQAEATFSERMEAARVIDKYSDRGVWGSTIPFSSSPLVRAILPVVPSINYRLPSLSALVKASKKGAIVDRYEMIDVFKDLERKVHRKQVDFLKKVEPLLWEDIRAIMKEGGVNLPKYEELRLGLVPELKFKPYEVDSSVEKRLVAERLVQRALAESNADLLIAKGKRELALLYRIPGNENVNEVHVEYTRGPIKKFEEGSYLFQIDGFTLKESLNRVLTPDKIIKGIVDVVDKRYLVGYNIVVRDIRYSMIDLKTLEVSEIMTLGSKEVDHIDPNRELEPFQLWDALNRRIKEELSSEPVLLEGAVSFEDEDDLFEASYS